MKLSTFLVPIIVGDRLYQFDRDIISEIDRTMQVDGFKVISLNKTIIFDFIMYSMPIIMGNF